MTVHIKIPGVLSSTTGLRRVIPTNNGFPSEGLTDLLLFADGADTAPVNSVAGRSAGAIEAPIAAHNAYSWLAGGGVQLEGTQIVTMPASDASTPWSLISIGSITGSIIDTSSEKLTGLLGFKEFAQGAVLRGAGLFVRGAVNWNIPTTAPYYQHRSLANGANKTPTNLAPSSGLSIIGQRMVRVFSYNGVDTLTSTIYNKDGTVMATATFAATDAEMFTVSGTTVTTLTPSAGLSATTYKWGRQEVEAFARYDRVLAAADIIKIIAAGVALGAARGRAWT